MPPDTRGRSGSVRGGLYLSQTNTWDGQTEDGDNGFQRFTNVLQSGSFDYSACGDVLLQSHHQTALTGNHRGADKAQGTL
jgi:hypothetical protein